MGAAAITSLDSGEANAVVIENIFTGLRDKMLRDHNWNFATARVKLARLSTAPAFEYDHAYALPSDWARTIKASADDAGFSTIDYTVEQVGGQRAILTNADDVYLRYIKRVTDTNLMPPDFQYALAMAITRDSAKAIAGASENEIEGYRRDARRALAQARSTDGIGAPARKRPAGTWATSRGGRFPPQAVRGD